MFNSYTNFFIDAIQTAKKDAVKQFVKHEAIAKSLNEFVDAQTAYTKDFVETSTKVSTSLGKEITSAVQEAVKRDYAKDITENITKMTSMFKAKESA